MFLEEQTTTGNALTSILILNVTALTCIFFLWTGACILASHVDRHSIWMRWCHLSKVTRPLSGSQMKARQGVAVDNRKRFDLWHGPSVAHPDLSRSLSVYPHLSHSGSDTKQMFTHTAATEPDTPCVLPFCHPWLHVRASGGGFCHLLYCLVELEKSAETDYIKPRVSFKSSLKG